MKHKIKFTNKAIEDLDSIWNYSARQWSEEQADRYWSNIMESCNRLSSNPSFGKSYNELADELYGLKSGKHIIFYTFSDTAVTIIRILHERMDLPSKISE